MTMRPFTDNRGGLNHLVDAQIGRAFPVVHKVYQHLDTIEYVAQMYEAGRSRDIVIRTNHTKEWIEWQYKGEAKWTILFKFSDLLGADIADVVAAEQAIAAELGQLRQQLAAGAETVIEARAAATEARLGAEAARDAASKSQAAAAQSVVTATQLAQNLGDATAAAEASAIAAQADREAAQAAQAVVTSSAQEASTAAVAANAARDSAQGSATEASAAKDATSLLQAAAAQSQTAAEAAVATVTAGVAEVAASTTTATEAATQASNARDTAVSSAVTATEQAATATASRAAAELAAATASAAQLSSGNFLTEVEQFRDLTQVLRNEAETFRDESLTYRNQAEQMQIDAQVVAADRQRAEDANAGAQDAATRAENAADQAASSEQASVSAASTAATAATELSGLLTDIDSRLDNADALRAQVQQLHDQTLEYKNAAENSTVNVRAVAEDRAAVTTMMGTIAADAASAHASAISAAGSKDQALAAAAIAAQAEAAANTAVTVAQDVAQAVVVDAQAVADDRAAVADMKVAVSADALAADTSRSQAEAAATAATAAAQNAVVDSNNAVTKANSAANNAAISKTGADSARDAAVAAKNAAEAALDSFDDRYLGAKAVAPTTDNDGGALLPGALYWDTVIGAMRAWSGSVWVTLTATTKASVGLPDADNTSDANKPVSTAQANAIALKADASALATWQANPTGVRSLNNGPLGGMRNRIINGCFRVAQRPAAVLAKNTSVYGGADRFFSYVGVFTTVSGVTAQRTTSDLAFSSSGFDQFMTLTTTGTGNVAHGTRLESKDVFDLSGKTITVRVNVYQDIGNLPVYLKLSKANAKDNFSVVTQVAQSAGASTPVGGRGTVTLTTTLGATDAANGLQVEVLMLNVGEVTNKNYVIANFSLELGTVATPFEHRHYGQELALCQRYYEEVAYSVDTANSSAAMYGSVFIAYKATKRALPTLSHKELNVSNCAFNSFQPTSVNGCTAAYNTGSAAGFATATLVADAEL